MADILPSDQWLPEGMQPSKRRALVCSKCGKAFAPKHFRSLYDGDDEEKTKCNLCSAKSPIVFCFVCRGPIRERPVGWGSYRGRGMDKRSYLAGRYIYFCTRHLALIDIVFEWIPKGRVGHTPPPVPNTNLGRDDFGYSYCHVANVQLRQIILAKYQIERAGKKLFQARRKQNAPDQQPGRHGTRSHRERAGNGCGNDIAARFGGETERIRNGGQDSGSQVVPHANHEGEARQERSSDRSVINQGVAVEAL